MRAIRFKVLYKNVYSNERRFRFGLADSPECGSCNAIESVEHQLYSCQNAKRLWTLYSQIFGQNVGDFHDVITCNGTLEQEIVKSVLIKLLIQIDRSTFLDLSAVKKNIIHFLMLEVAVLGDEARETQALRRLIDQIRNL